MSDVNVILNLTRCLVAQTACQNSVCSAFYVTRKIGRSVILRLLGPLEVCAGARQHDSAPDFDRTAGHDSARQVSVVLPASDVCVACSGLPTLVRCPPSSCSPQIRY